MAKNGDSANLSSAPDNCNHTVTFSTEVPCNVTGTYRWKTPQGGKDENRGTQLFMKGSHHLDIVVPFSTKRKFTSATLNKIDQLTSLPELKSWLDRSCVTVCLEDKVKPLPDGSCFLDNRLEQDIEEPIEITLWNGNERVGTFTATGCSYKAATFMKDIVEKTELYTDEELYENYERTIN